LPALTAQETNPAHRGRIARMNKGKLALRLIYAFGLASFWIADWIGDHQPAPWWFASALSDGAMVVAISTALLWISLEVLLHYVPNRGIWVTAYAVSVVAVVVPAFYLTSAALFGAEKANINTWHLASMFTVVNQVLAIVATLAIAIMVGLILWIVQTGSRLIAGWRARNS
jgi:hypothetical protein